jgi:hypothetical protein
MRTVLPGMVLSAAAVLVATAGLFLVLASPTLAAPDSPTKGQTAAECFEDMPCWRWSEMGNRKRGVTLKSGRVVVVHWGRMIRLDSRCRIDWTVTPRLKGDPPRVCRRR